MDTLLVFHEVEDVDHWLASPKREEFFGPLGITVRTFRDPGGSNQVGLLVETPDMAAWESALQSDEAAEAMKHDGVRPRDDRRPRRGVAGRLNHGTPACAGVPYRSGAANDEARAQTGAGEPQRRAPRHYAHRLTSRTLGCRKAGGGSRIRQRSLGQTLRHHRSEAGGLLRLHSRIPLGSGVSRVAAGPWEEGWLRVEWTRTWELVSVPSGGGDRVPRAAERSSLRGGAEEYRGPTASS